MSKGKYSIPFRRARIVVVKAPFHDQQEAMKHCIDFFLPKGTPVLAARDGVVVARESRYSKAYNSPEYVDRANYVLIRHSDGEVSVYAHLQYRSVRCRVGQKVKRGQVIALSGQTGYAGYPHLHFGVYDGWHDDDRPGTNLEISFDDEIESERMSLERAMKT